MNKIKNRNLMAAVSYSLFYITAIAVLLIEKRDRFVRFHAMQSLILFGGIFIANILVNFVFVRLGILRLFGDFLSTLLVLGAIILWAISIFRAIRGDVFKWPWVGEMASKRVGEVA